MAESKKEKKTIEKEVKPSENKKSEAKKKNTPKSKTEKKVKTSTSESDLKSENTFVAVIETGSKQYVIKDGDILDIEKLTGDKDGNVVFDKVLLLSDGNETTIGTPFIEGATINGSILNQYKDKKKIVFKFKKKTGYKRFKGHRQQLTTVKFS